MSGRGAATIPPAGGKRPAPVEWDKFPIVTPFGKAFQPYVNEASASSKRSRREPTRYIERPEHRVYHMTKFGANNCPPKDALHKLQFIRAKAPVMELPEKKKPKAGSKVSAHWHRQYRRNYDRWQKNMAKPPMWKMRDTDKELWEGKPDNAWGPSYARARAKQTKYLLLELIPEKKVFVCHAVSKYSFTKQAQTASKKSIEDAEAEMKMLNKNIIPSTKQAQVIAQAEEIAVAKKIEESESAVFQHKHNSETYNIYSAIKPEEGCYDAHMSDDDVGDEKPEDTVVAEDNHEELTLEERNNMTKTEKKMKVGMALVQQGKSLEAVSKQVTEKKLEKAAAELADEEGHAEFDAMFRDEDGGDDDEDEDEDEDDSDIGLSDIEDDEKQKQKKPSRAGGDEKVATSSSSSARKGPRNTATTTKEESEEESEESEEDDDKTPSITAQDIKNAIRKAPTGRLDVTELIYALEDKLRSNSAKAEFKRLVDELCNPVQQENKMYFVLKEDEEKKKKRAVARRRRERERERKRKEKEAQKLRERQRKA